MEFITRDFTQTDYTIAVQEEDRDMILLALRAVADIQDRLDALERQFAQERNHAD